MKETFLQSELSFKEFLDNHLTEKKDYLILYHATIKKNIPSIKKQGLIDQSSNYSAGWFMLSDEPNSAIFHSPYAPEENLYPVVITFKIPVIEVKRRWDGFPYVWPPHQGKGYKWYALMKPLPPEFITNVRDISEKEWFKIKNKGF